MTDCKHKKIEPTISNQDRANGFYWKCADCEKLFLLQSKIKIKIPFNDHTKHFSYVGTVWTYTLSRTRISLLYSCNICRKWLDRGGMKYRCESIHICLACAEANKVE